MSFDVHTEWLKYNGKKLVASESIGSDNVVRVNGLDYDLVTASDASELSDMDLSEAQFEQSDEDDDAFESGERSELTEGEAEIRGIAEPSTTPKKSALGRVKNPLKKMNSFGGMVTHGV